MDTFAPRAALAMAASLIATSAFAAPGTPPATFNRCTVCHNAAKGAPAKIGPDLWGVYGRKAATQAGFKYSAALTGAKLKWDDATLDKWLAGPMTLVPGTAMAFPGLKDAAKRAEVIAYLKSLK
ncbi:cytochrome c family protein [Novosphingobium sp. FKTRR1]|uniref:c-type cytochrome n=1 Tax=Novosphingobium sp. FKTRR1 TaxID=2879118 RepID=UPI001CF044F8|nr:c-type cytochrome [Novosphingobium sp. FKTRR1]